MFARHIFHKAGFIVLLALNMSLFAQQEAFDLCARKAKDAAIFEDGKLLLPVSDKLWLGYTAGPPPQGAVRYDPFLGLFLVRREHTFAYPYRFERCGPESIALIDERAVTQGKLKRRQAGLNTLATFTEPAQLPSLLSGCCCGIEGIVTERGIIEKAYIAHFLNHKEALYGDIGIRVADSDNGVVVTAVDPYAENTPLKAGDRILSCGGKKVLSAARLMQDILFAPAGSRLQIGYARDGATMSYDANVSRRFGGGLLSDTFLERLGLFFDAEGIVLRVEREAASYGINVGDRIVKIGDETIRNRDDLLRAAGKMQKNATLLVGRGGFSFFIRLP